MRDQYQPAGRSRTWCALRASGSCGGVAFHDWRLDAANVRGHRMHIDISTAAVTNTNGWMRPLVLSDLFDSAQAVTIADTDPSLVLVPGDTHQLVLVCEKAQRKHRYDARVQCDATVLVRGGLLDGAAVAEATRQFGLTPSLRWALGPDHTWHDQALQLARPCLIRADRRDGAPHASSISDSRQCSTTRLAALGVAEPLKVPGQVRAGQGIRRQPRDRVQLPP